jgi:hypothetical protein
MRRMAGRWSDEHITASLNRLGMRTDQGKSWTARHVRDWVLTAEQVVRGAPYQIKAADLLDEQVAAALRGKARPCRAKHQNQTSMFSDT